MAMCGHYIIKTDVVLGLLGNFRVFGGFQAENGPKIAKIRPKSTKSSIIQLCWSCNFINGYEWALDNYNWCSIMAFGELSGVRGFQVKKWAKNLKKL